MAIEKIDKVIRTIHYYELDINFEADYNHNEGCRMIFDKINNLLKAKSKNRYQNYLEKAFFIQEISFVKETKIIRGKLKCIRKDILPELLNTNTDESRGIEAAEEEGIVESTHFIFDYSDNKANLAIEFNQFGAKIKDFIFYIQSIGTFSKLVKTIGHAPIVKDDLRTFKDRINRCSRLIAKVHKDNIHEIQRIDSGLYSSINAAYEQFTPEYAYIELKFEYKLQKIDTNVNNTINNLINAILKDRKKIELFNILEVHAEDSDKNNLIEVFDLLIDKVKSEIKVEKRKRFRTLVSTDMFEKMQREMRRKLI